LAKCATCRVALAEERSLKTLIKTNAGIVRTPADVRLRIRAAIGDIAEPRVNREPASAEAAMRRGATAGSDGVAGQRHEAGRLVAQSSRRWLWGSIGGVAAMVIVTLALVAGHGSNPGDEAIDQPVPVSPAQARLSRRFRLSAHGHWPVPLSLATTRGVSVDVLSSGY